MREKYVVCDEGAAYRLSEERFLWISDLFKREVHRNYCTVRTIFENFVKTGPPKYHLLVRTFTSWQHPTQFRLPLPDILVYFTYTMDVCNISYSVNIGGKAKRLLKNVGFSIKSGELCALMGPSGAGKSTLLDLLSDRKKEGTWSGDVYIDNKPRSNLFAKETAYVLQDDVHYATLTVEETLQYAAWTRLDPTKMTASDKQKRIEDIMESMSLKHIRANRVGSAFTKGISGGEKKRLSIAVEILSQPKLIFLDEPTSGLDSSIALEVMTAVRNITKGDRTTLTTIHQPSQAIFALFDQLALLSSGRLIFFGTPSQAIEHFTNPSVGYVFVGRYRNPAEFLLEISGGHVLPERSAVPLQPAELEAHFSSSKYCQASALQAKSDSSVSTASTSYSGQASSGGPQDLYATSAYVQLQMLMHRTLTAQIRDVPAIKAQFTMTIISGFVLGFICFGKGQQSTPFYENGDMDSGVYNLNAILFEIVIFTAYDNINVVAYLVNNTYQYRRELAANAYSTLPYWVSHIVTPLPLLAAKHVVFVMIYFFLCQLPANGEYFFYFYTITFLCTFLSYASAMAIAAHTNSIVDALFLFPIQFILQAVFTGFAVKIHDLPPMWAWATYVSYTRWVFEGLMINQWDRYDTDDQSGEAQDGNGDILGEYGFYDMNKGGPMGVLLLFFAMFFAILYYGLIPPASQLKKVLNADHAVSTTSKVPLLEFVYKGPLRSAITAKRHPHNVKSSPDNKLDEKLIHDSDMASDSSAGGTVPEPVVNYSPPLRTESYQVSSGAVPLSRGCCLEFHDVRYTIPSLVEGKPDNVILKGVSGRMMSGEMCAIMGSSGAGKSTLLDILAQRKCVGIPSGKILYDGVPTIHSYAYVLQDDVHMPVLTVKETIFFAAELRLSSAMSTAEKAARVDKIIGIMALTSVQDSMVGNAFVRGISGGQLKRVSIAVEIVHLPDLLMLDEPTTGLDSSIALQVVCALRNLANQNRTVVCTIHQPSEDILELFDSVLLLGQGRVIYFGPAARTVEYFLTSPFKFAPPSALTNPADFFVAAAGGALPAADGRQITPSELALHYNSTAAAQTLLKQLEGAPPVKSTTSSITTTSDMDKSHVEPLSVQWHEFWYKLKILLHRRMVVMGRTWWTMLTMLVLRHALIGLLYGTVWYQLGSGTDGHLYTDRFSVVYFTATLMVYAHLARIGELFSDRNLYYRERRPTTYGPLAYWVSLWLPMIPLFSFVTLLTCGIVYPMTGMREGGAYFFLFFFFVLFCGFAGMFQIYFVTAMSPSAQAALSFAPMAILIQMVPAGYFIYLPELVVWMRVWLPYLSFIRYAQQGLILNEMQDNDDLPKATHYIHEFGYNTISLEGCAALLLLFCASYAILFYLALKYVDFE